MADLHIVRQTAADSPLPATNNCFDEERREVLESVMGALSSAVPDPDEMAACSYLLTHLVQIVGKHAA